MEAQDLSISRVAQCLFTNNSNPLTEGEEEVGPTYGLLGRSQKAPRKRMKGSRTRHHMGGKQVVSTCRAKALLFVSSATFVFGGAPSMVLGRVRFSRTIWHREER